MWHRFVGWLVCAAPLTAGPSGCQERAPPRPPAATGPARATPVDRPAFDESEGYLHKPSGVGFTYPDGWENLGVTDRGPITSLGLRRREPAAEVTLYWSQPDTPIDAASVGNIEYEGLGPVYGAKLGRPEPIRAGDQPGFRLAIAGGPLGQAGQGLTGVTYVFAVRREGQPWKIKLRATAGSREGLAAAEELLRYYRW